MPVGGGRRRACGVAGAAAAAAALASLAPLRAPSGLQRTAWAAPSPWARAADAGASRAAATGFGGRAARDRGSSLALRRRGVRLRASYSNFSEGELRAALGQLGAYDDLPGLSKRDLAERLRELHAGPREVLQMLRAGRRANGGGDAARASFWHFSASQLRAALSSAGFLERTDGWVKGQLVKALQDLRVKPADVAAAPCRRPGPAARQRAEFARFGPGGATGRPRQRPGRPENPEWAWFQKDFVRKPSYEDEYWEERAQRQDRPEVSDGPRRARAGRGSSAAQRQAAWDDEDESWFEEYTRQRSQWRPPLDPRPPPERVPWQQAAATAEEAMDQALHQGWAAERLSRAQAASLLGTSGRPSAEEVTRARKQLVLRYHPDRNPGDPKAEAALRLVVAASDRLAAPAAPP